MTKEQREAVHARLAHIEQANGGRLTPDAVVKDARDSKSPLHRFFTWDVKKAAQAHWIEQARDLITSVRVTVRVDRTQVSTVFYVRDPSAGRGEQGYIGFDKLRSEQDMAREAVVAEFSRAADMLRRAKQLAKALELQDEVDQLLTDVVSLRDRVQASTAQPQ